MTRVQICSLYLASVVFLWRFQVGFGGAAVPVYVFLAPITLMWGVNVLALQRTLVAATIAAVTMMVALLQGVPFSRGLVSIVALLVFLFNWLAVGTSFFSAQTDRWKTLAGFVRILIRLQVTIQIMEIMGFPFLENRISPHYFLPIIRAPGLSIEPSHVAITFAPLIFSSLWPRRSAWGGHLGPLDYALVYLSVFLSPSATGLFVIGLAVFLRISIKWPLIAVASGGIAFILGQGIFSFVSYLPAEIRIRFEALVTIFELGQFDSRSNLSSVVFYGGFQAALTSLKDFPLGVGFMNMETVYNLPRFEPYREVAGNSNIRDGSSVLFKLITEFGYIGLALAVTAVVSLWSFLARRPPDIMIGVLVFPLIAFFVRGASYFDGTVIISLALVVFGLMNNGSSMRRSVTIGTK